MDGQTFAGCRKIYSKGLTMYPYYKLIKIDLRLADFSRIKGQYLESFGTGYHNFEIKDHNYVDDLIKNQIKFLIPPDHMYYTEISHEGLNPHVDNCSVALNYCVTSPASNTIFFRAKNDSKAQLVENHTENEADFNRTYEWALHDLDTVASVSLAEHTAFLLNTQEIHCVQKQNSQPRAHIRWVWRTVPYKIVERSIIEL